MPIHSLPGQCAFIQRRQSNCRPSLCRGTLQVPFRRQQMSATGSEQACLSTKTVHHPLNRGDRDTNTSTRNADETDNAHSLLLK
jgi:hypothetical protein